MANSNRPKLPFDSRGGVIIVSRAMLESTVYKSMSPTAKVLMVLLHVQWRNERAVAYGVREAAENIGCRLNTTSKAFNVLQERGFIICVNQSLFNSRTGSAAREWRSTWMPFEGKEPTHEWQKWQPIN